MSEINIPDEKRTPLVTPCVICPMNDHEKAFGKRFGSRTNRESDILVVTRRAVNRIQLNGLEPFANLGITELMRKGFKQLKRDLESISFVAEMRCSFPEKEIHNKVKLASRKVCREYLFREIITQKPELIIPMGADACRQVFGRAIAITKVVGQLQWNDQFNCWVFPMLDPLQVDMRPEKLPDWNTGWRMLRRLRDNSYDMETMSDEVISDANYEVVDDLQFLIDREPTMLSIDVETTRGLDWFNPINKIATFQITDNAGEAYMVLWDHDEASKNTQHRRKLMRQFKKLLTDKTITLIGQNLKFDAIMILEKWGFRIRIGGDTLLLQSCLDENQKNKSLSQLVKINVPSMAGYSDVFDSTVDKANLGSHPIETTEGVLGLREYGCGDVDATWRLHEVIQTQVIDDHKLWNYYIKVLLPAVNAFVMIEHRGLRIDTDQLHTFKEQLQQYVTEMEANLISRIPQKIVQDHTKMGKAIKFSRHDLVRDILFSKDGFSLTPLVFTKGTQNLKPSEKVASTSTKDHLPYFFNTSISGKFCVDLAEFIKISRLLNTNVEKFEEKYIHGDSIHPTYNFHVAVTGRSSSANPNAQNFPARGTFVKPYKRMFVPPDGCIMLAPDLSQAELRIAAVTAEEDTMMNVYRAGGDIHTQTAANVLNMTIDEFNNLPSEGRDLRRFHAKAVNFGFIYGMGAPNFVTYAKTTYGVDFTLDEAEAYRDRFFDGYGKLLNWHASVRQHVMRYKYVRSYDGRIRHLPQIDSDDRGVRGEAQRAAINAPIQEFASALATMAIARLDKYIDSKYLACNGFVHDAVYAYCPMEYFVWAAHTMKKAMETIPIKKWFGIDFPIPIIADVKFGINGGDVWELPSEANQSRFIINDWVEEENAKIAEKRFTISNKGEGDDLPPYIPHFPEQKIPPMKGRFHKSGSRRIRVRR